MIGRVVRVSLGGLLAFLLGFLLYGAWDSEVRRHSELALLGQFVTGLAVLPLAVVLGRYRIRPWVALVLWIFFEYAAFLGVLVFSEIRASNPFDVGAFLQSPFWLVVFVPLNLPAGILGYCIGWRVASSSRRAAEPVAK
jgi:hypothetical protein